MKIAEIITEKWSQKYKSSINCNNPKGFSQKAHCAGRKKTNEVYKQKDGDYARPGKWPAKKKRGPHPLGGKLVGG